MTHQRRLIRHSVVDRLLDRTDAGPRVFKTRMRPLFDQELPAILVYSMAERSDHRQTAPRELKRDLRLGIEIVAKADEGLDDVLDDIADQVEAIMSADDTLSGNAADCWLTVTDIRVVKDGDTVMGACRLTYSVEYYTQEPREDTLQDHYTFQPGEQQPGDFGVGNVEWDLADEIDEETGEMRPDGAIEAEDNFDVPIQGGE